MIAEKKLEELGIKLNPRGKELIKSMEAAEAKVKPEVVTKKPELKQKVKVESDIDAQAISESTSSSKDFGKPTAREVVQENPFVAKKYLQEIEELTGRDLPEMQVRRLKEELQTREFRELSKQDNKLHRAEFEKVRDELRAEWERETKQTWPKYEVMDLDTGKPKFINYDAHHIIQNNHGGPHEWWNIHPALREEHQKIHGTGSRAREIFNANIKK